MKTDREILGIGSHTTITEKLVKQKYREMALRLHPDKNGSTPTAVAQFQELGAAYERLCNGVGLNVKPDVRTLFENIIEHITEMCEETALAYLDKLEKGILIHIQQLLYMNRDGFPFGNKFLEKIAKILSAKEGSNGNKLVVRPTLADLFDNNLYRYCVDDHILIIPMWHHELVYDISGVEFLVECLPILPEGCTINEKNDIFIKKEFEMLYVIKCETLAIEICEGWTCVIEVKNLLIRREQIYHLCGVGISRQNIKDMYNIEKRGDIFVNLVLGV